MKVCEVQDKYNNDKTWVIKKTKCGHYYINQKIKGRFFYPRFQRVSLSFIHQVIGEILYKKRLTHKCG